MYMNLFENCYFATKFVYACFIGIEIIEMAEQI